MNIIYSQKLKQFAIQHGFSTKSYSYSDQIIFPKQKNTNKVIIIDKLKQQEADGIITDKLHQRIGVKTADCLPMLFYESEKHIAAAVHAGWKGTAAKIGEEAVKAILKHGGKVESLYVAFGPSIEFDCYDIPEERAPKIKEALGEDKKFLKKNHGQYFFNLQYANYKQLVMSGIPEANITKSSPDVSPGGESGS